MGAPLEYQTTAAQEWHPHDLPTHEPWATLDGVLLIACLRRVRGRIRVPRRDEKQRMASVDAPFTFVKSLDRNLLEIG